MGFCRSCGELVLQERCKKCGGKPIQAAFKWSDGKGAESATDRWKQKYMTKDETTSLPPREPSPERFANRRAMFEQKETPVTSTVTPNRRFPLPQSSSQAQAPLHNDISTHISATTSQTLTPASTAPLTKESISHSPSGNPIIDDGFSLSKVYGSVLQSPETLKSYACADCNTVFTRDMTLYPDPESPESTQRFLCRACFLGGGGIKADCAGCSKPILRLRHEGKCVENGGRIWHQKCFECDGCGKNIAANPSVDLYGRPCCPDCFDTSLSRSPNSKPKSRPRTVNASPVRGEGDVVKSVGGSNVGGLNARESSPAMEELSKRLGVSSRDPSPGKPPPPSPLKRSNAMGSLKTENDAPNPTPATPQRRAATRIPSISSLPRGISSSGSPSLSTRKSTDRLGSFSVSGRDLPSAPAVDELSSKLATVHMSSTSVPRSRAEPVFTPSDLGSSTSTVRGRKNDLISSPGSRIPFNTKARQSLSKSTNAPATPDLVNGETSDGTGSTNGSTWSSPPTPKDVPYVDSTSNAALDTTPTPTSRISYGLQSQAQPTSLKNALDSTVEQDDAANDPKCKRCHKPLFSIEGGGRIVGVPQENGQDARYHADCFVCAACGQAFKETVGGTAAFVRSEIGITHVECAPPPKVTIIPKPRPMSMALGSMRQDPASTGTKGAIPRANSQIPKARPMSMVSNLLASTSTTPVTALPTNACPGCKKGVTMFEPGVVPGPSNSRWHSSCLVCGGKNSRDRKVGCGKRLDRDARMDAEGKVWCSNCWGSVGGVARSPLSPTITGGYSSPMGYPRPDSRTGGNYVFPNNTGSLSQSVKMPIRQVTLGASTRTRTPTRSGSVSPTKGMLGRALTSRPKSVSSMRGVGGTGEGRGIELLRQMTGSSAGGSEA